MIRKPFWKPTNTIIEASNIYKMMQKQGFENYSDFWRWSVNEKASFLHESISALRIRFKKNYTELLDLQKGVEAPIWLKDAKLNIVDSCFQNTAKEAAIIHGSAGEDPKIMSQQELLALVNKIANGLRNLGLKEGDSIAIDMPMTPEAIAIYLAGIKAGHPIVTIADSFTPNEIAVRIRIASPKVIFTQDIVKRAGKDIELYQKVIASKAPMAIVVSADKNEVDLRDEDIFWSDFLSENEEFESVIQSPEDVITVLFSSGTTGEPKAIPWTQITPLKCAMDAYYHQDIHQNDVVCWPTNLGWMMGPWLVFAALINKAAIALYSGAPTESGFGAFVQNARVTMLGVIPSIVKHWKNKASMEVFNWNSIRCFSSTGEVSNPEEMEYLMELANNKPVIEYCGGTEIGGGYVTSTVVQTNIASAFSTQALGGEFVLLNDKSEVSSKGELFLISPILGNSNTLLNRNHHEVYFKGTPTINNMKLRRHGDQLEQLENGYYVAQGRVDDAMNLGGIKVSSVQIEKILNALDFVKESAAIAVSPKEGGPSVLIIYYVETNSKYETSERLKTCQNVIRKQLNPLFKIKTLLKLDELPRTASNKVMRRKLRDLYENQ